MKVGDNFFAKQLYEIQIKKLLYVLISELYWRDIKNYMYHQILISGHKLTVSVSELQNAAVDLALNYKNNLNTIKISEILSFKQQYQYFLIQS